MNKGTKRLPAIANVQKTKMILDTPFDYTNDTSNAEKPRSSIVANHMLQLLC